MSANYWYPLCPRERLPFFPVVPLHRTGCLSCLDILRTAPVGRGAHMVSSYDLSVQFCLETVGNLVQIISLTLL